MRVDETRPTIGRRPRARTATTVTALLGGALATVSLTLALLLRIGALLSGHVGTWRVDMAVEVAVLAGGALVALWLACSALVATLCVLARGTGATWRAGERLVQRYAPQVVRRALVLAVAGSIGFGVASGASAAVPDPVPSISASAVVAPAAVADDLGWVVTSRPDASVEAPQAPEPPAAVNETPQVAEPSTATAEATAAAVATSRATVVVATGDTLWAIAARHLPPGATDAQVAAAWPAWYEANADVVGADPDLVRPGQELVVPATAEASR